MPSKLDSSPNDSLGASGNNTGGSPAGGGSGQGGMGGGGGQSSPSSPSRPASAPKGASGGSGGGGGGQGGSTIVERTVAEKGRVRGTMHGSAGGSYSSKMRRRDPTRGRHGLGQGTPGAGASLGAGPSSPARPRNAGSSMPALGSGANPDSDRLLNPEDIPSADADEPQDMAPKPIDPNNPNADPYNTIDDKYKDDLDPTNDEDGETDEDGNPKEKDPSETDLANKEKDADPGSKALAPSSQAEQDRFGDDKLGRGYNNKGRGEKGKRGLPGIGRIIPGGKGKQAAVGGGITGVVLTLVMMALGIPSFEMQHYRERFLGSLNRPTNSVLAARRGASSLKVARKMAAGNVFQKSINEEKFAAKLGKQGYTIEFTDGKLTKYEYKATNGSIRSLDFTKPLKDAEKDFFAGGVGREARRSLDTASSSRINQFKGRAGRRLLSLLKVDLVNWLHGRGKGPGGEDLTDSEKYAHDWRHSDDATNPDGSTKTTTNVNDADGNGEADDPTQRATNELAEGIDDMEGSADYRKRALADPRLGDAELIDGIAKGGAEAVGGTLDNATTSVLDAATRELGPDAMREVATNSLKGLPSKAFLIVNAVGPVQLGCRLVGTLNYIANVRNVLFAMELSRFAVKWYTIADHQRAGLVQSEGVKLMMLYMHYPNPQNGKTFSQSGGVLRAAGHQKDAYINPIHLGKGNTGRDQKGTLATIHNFVTEKVPLVNNPSACKFVNNGVVQVVTLAGTVAVSVIAAVFSGGASTALNAQQIAISLGLAVLTEVAFQIGTPLLIKAGARMALNGLEKNGEYVGDMLAAGMGAYFASSGGANGLRLSTKAKLTQVTEEANLEYRETVAKQSLFERYLNIDNADSMASRLAVSLPAGNSAMLNAVGFGLPNLTASLANIGGFATALLPTSKASAANDYECKDKQVVKYDIATDAFCNPIMVNAPDLDLDETESMLLANKEIDPAGKPIGEDFLEYIKDCHVGRTGTLYRADVSKDGNNNPESGTCIEPGDPLPGDSVGKYDRFSAWYGYTVDESNFVEDFNGEYEVDGVTSVQPAAPKPGTITGCPNQPVDAGQTVMVNGIQVHTCIQKNLTDMMAAASAAGINLGGSGWRDVNDQIRLRTAHCGSSDYDIYEKPSGECSPPTAIPGRSLHEQGLAIDFTCDGGSFGGTACFDWMVTNAITYGFKNLPSEAWHWSTTGN